MLQRMLGAVMLSSNTYEDVEHDRGAMVQALGVVVIVAIATAVGGVLDAGEEWIRGVGFGVIRGVLLWALWALGAWIVGSTILKTSATKANWGELARGTGFAQTPGLLNALAFLDDFGRPILIVVVIWQFAAMLVAVRASLDYTSLWRAFFVVAIAAIPVFIIYLAIVIFLGIGGGESEPPPVSQILLPWYHALG